jgi:RimJ/RimL family protein N-acetyltransferase
LLEGKNLNLRIVEKEDLPLVAEWFNNPDFSGRFDPLDAQESRMEIEKKYEGLSSEEKWFIIEKKDGTKIGFIGHFPVRSNLEIGYALIPNERRKGYGTEAVLVMVDYLFLSKSIVRIQAGTNVENEASQKVLEKVGFQKEGLNRREVFVRGKWTDFYNYSILREEWKEPKILTKIVSG